MMTLYGKKYLRYFTTASTQSVVCPRTPPAGYTNRNGKEYKVYTTPTSFMAAEKQCNTDGARLAMFKTAEDYNAIKDVHSKCTKEFFCKL